MVVSLEHLWGPQVTLEGGGRDKLLIGPVLMWHMVQTNFGTGFILGRREGSIALVYILYCLLVRKAGPGGCAFAPALYEDGTNLIFRALVPPIRTHKILFTGINLK